MAITSIVFLLIGVVMMSIVLVQFFTVLYLKHFGTWSDKIRIIEHGIRHYVETFWLLPVAIICLLVALIINY